MARGTGLPSIGSGAITALVDTSGYGAAEKANAEGLSQLAAGLDNLRQRVLDPLAQEQARKDAGEAVARGDYSERDQITAYGQEYTRLIRGGHLSRLNSDDDEFLNQAVIDADGDPERFAQATNEWRTQSLDTGRIPGAMAVDWGVRFRARSQAMLDQIRLERANADRREAGATLLARKTELEDRLTLAAEGAGDFDPALPAFQMDTDELLWVYDQIAGNSALNVSPELAERMREESFDRFRAAAIGGVVRNIYRAEGEGAALEVLRGLLPPAGGVGGESVFVAGGAAPDGAAQSFAEALHRDQEARLTLDAAAESPISPRARDMAYARAVAVLGQERTLSQQVANVEQSRRTAARQQAENLIEAMRYGGQVNHDELRRAAEASGDVGMIARSNFAIEVGVAPPEGFGSGGGGGSGSGFDGDTSAAAGFEPWFEHLVQSEGGAAVNPDDNGAGPSQFGITRRSHPEAWADGRVTRAEAQAIARREYWDAIGADSLPPALAGVAAEAAYIAGPENARQWLGLSEGDVGQFLALQEAHYRRLAAQDPGRYGDDLPGWLNRLAQTRARAVRIQAFAINQDGFASDPLATAMGGPNRPALANVAPLLLDGVFGTPQQQATWAQGLQARRATGATLARQYQAPERMLTNAEVETYKQRFEADPPAAIAFANAATQTLGAGGARALLAEIGMGGASPTLIHIADLSTHGADQRFASQAALGLQLQAQQQPVPASATDTLAEIEEAVLSYRTSFRDQPSLLSAVRSTARAAAIADASTGTLRDPDYYAQAAMGQTQWGGRRYGGGAVVNGVTTVVPRWLNPEYFDDALEALASEWGKSDLGPVYSNGEAMPASVVGRLRPVLMTDGRYRLVDRRGNVAMTPTGDPYDVNLERGRDFLARTLGDQAVRR